MPALTEDSTTPPAEPQFSVFHQKISLDIDLAGRAVTGKAEIDIRPHSKELKTLRLNCRQCTVERVTVEWRREPRAVQFSHQDPYMRLTLSSLSTVHSHELLRRKIDGQLREPPEEELVITLPKWLNIVEEDPSSVAAQEAQLSVNEVGTKSDGLDGTVATGTSTVAASFEHGTVYQPVKIYVDYVMREFRDGLHFVGLEEGDTRYPHLYTRNSMFPGTACCVFPCLDNATSRCQWDISIRCPRTLGDAFRPSKALSTSGVNGHASRENAPADSAIHDTPLNDQTLDGRDTAMTLSEEEKALDVTVVCSGDMTDEIVDPKDPSRKTVSFSCTTPVAAQHIGFAVGPFEHTDLSEFRESDQDEKLGDKATPVHGFCLPGRIDELRNTCVPLAMAIDRFTLDYGFYPFSNYKICFVDDLIPEVASTASLSICSSRLLFPFEILEPLESVTRTLIHALACQWSGVYITAQDPGDAWITVGGAYFMADMFLGSFLLGKNEFRFRQKMAADALSDLDVSRPSLYQLGTILTIHPGEMGFMALKAPLVLFILHQRLIKASGRNGINRVFWRLFLNAKVDETQRSISTQGFLRSCEKIGHQKLDAFFNQWVYGAGCPHFWVTQRFNKKKLVIEMSIRQAQAEKGSEHKLEPGTFIQEVQEDKHNVWADPVQPLFTGPMTIRIHEADGTPYEHIIEIKEVLTKFEIPYNTKYKRLKRSRRAKERAAAAAGIDISGDAQDDILLYCLGDVLQSEEEVGEWRLTDWSKEDEEKMSQESYEWIRVDKDFEWICKMSFGQPHYMFVSQLQQDNDVVAQVEAIKYLTLQQPFPIISTILVRTLMDRRYFYGVRMLAADALAKCAKEDLDWIGLFHLEKAFQEFFCFPDSPMTRSNDFLDRTAYLIQCTIPKAIAKIRDGSGKAPMRVKQFFVDKLKFNDNTNNEFSDCHYIATLMSCLAESLVVKRGNRGYDFSFDDGDDEEDELFQRSAINEIERYRRIDEHLGSFHNVYSITALECLELLIRNKVLPLRMTDFVQYTRPGNADEVRLKAFSCLMELGLLKNPAILRHTLYSFAREPSPYVRDRLWHIIGLGFGHIAIGTSKPQPQSPQHGGLIVEQEGSNESRQAEIARTQTVPGALAALKDEIGRSEVLMQALRNALTSPILGLKEYAGVLDVCGLFYEPDNTLWVSWKYPRYYQVEHMGNGKLKFTKTNKVRTKPVAPIQWPLPPPLRTKASSPSLKRQRSESIINGEQPSKKQQQSAKPPAAPASNIPQTKPAPHRTILKITSKKLAAITQSQPSANSPAPAAQPPPAVSGTQPPQPAHANGVNGSGAAMSPPAEGKVQKLKLKLGSKPK